MYFCVLQICVTQKAVSYTVQWKDWWETHLCTNFKVSHRCHPTSLAPVHNNVDEHNLLPSQLYVSFMSAFAILFTQYVLRGLLIHTVCKCTPSPSSPARSGPPNCESCVDYTEIYKISFLLFQVWILNVKTQQQVLYQHESGSCCLKLLWLHFFSCHNCAICLELLIHWERVSSPALFTQLLNTNVHIKYRTWLQLLYSHTHNSFTDAVCSWKPKLVWNSFSCSPPYKSIVVTPRQVMASGISYIESQHEQATTAILPKAHEQY